MSENTENAGSFWSTFTQLPTFDKFASSEIDEILTSPNCNLDDLLNSDEFLQELRSHHENLIKFTTKPSSLNRLIELITQESDSNASDIRIKKLPSIANEAICLEIEPVITALTNSSPEYSNILPSFWKFLDNNPPLNPVLAGFFNRSATAIINKAYKQVSEFIQNNKNILSKFLIHIQSRSITEVLKILITNSILDFEPNFLLSSLFAHFDQFENQDQLIFAEKAENITILLSAILTTDITNYELLKELRTPKISKFLTDLFYTTNFTAIKSSVSIITLIVHLEGYNSIFENISWETIYDYNFENFISKQNNSNNINEFDNQYDDFDENFKLKNIQNSLSNLESEIYLDITIIPHLKQIKKLLSPIYINNFSSVGLISIEILRFISTMLISKSNTIPQLIIDENILNEVVELFFNFQWNNIMHIEANKIFECYLLLGVNKTSLLKSFFTSTQFIIKSFEILEMDRRIRQISCKETRRVSRLLVGGLINHLFRFFYLLNKASIYSLWISQFLRSLQYWDEFYSNTINFINNTKPVIQSETINVENNIKE